MYLAKNSKLIHNILLKSVNATKFDELARSTAGYFQYVPKLPQHQPAFYRGCTLQSEYTMLGWCPRTELTLANREEIPMRKYAASNAQHPLLFSDMDPTEMSIDWNRLLFS